MLHFQLGVRLAAGEAGVFAYDSAMANVKDMEHLKHLLDEQATSTLTPEQKAAIRSLFESFGLI